MSTRGPGRPPMPAGTAHVESFTLKISAEEYAEIEWAAGQAKTAITAWARGALLAAARVLRESGTPKSEEVESGTPKLDEKVTP